jgi:hypothetical protein
MFLPPNNDLEHKFKYGYMTHADQQVLFKVDMQAMEYVKTIDLKEFACVPQGVAYLPLGTHALLS